MEERAWYACKHLVFLVLGGSAFENSPEGVKQDEHCASYGRGATGLNVDTIIIRARADLAMHI